MASSVLVLTHDLSIMSFLPNHSTTANFQNNLLMKCNKTPDNFFLKALTPAQIYPPAPPPTWKKYEQIVGKFSD